MLICYYCQKDSFINNEDEYFWVECCFCGAKGPVSFTKEQAYELYKNHICFDIDKAAECFLSIKLPEDFMPDNGIEFNTDTSNRPTGTNLFTYNQCLELFDKLVKKMNEELV